MYILYNVGRKSYICLNARDGESISISNAAIGADTTESLKNAVSVSLHMTTIFCEVIVCKTSDCNVILL